MDGWDNLAQTALHIASQEKNVDIVRFLLESNADVNAETMDGDTPLFPGFRPSLESTGDGMGRFCDDHTPSA